MDDRCGAVFLIPTSLNLRNVSAHRITCFTQDPFVCDKIGRHFIICANLKHIVVFYAPSIAVSHPALSPHLHVGRG